MRHDLIVFFGYCDWTIESSIVLGLHLKFHSFRCSTNKGYDYRFHFVASFLALPVKHPIHLRYYFSFILLTFNTELSESVPRTQDLGIWILAAPVAFVSARVSS